MKNEERYYYCYSKPLDNFIRKHGIKPFNRGIHARTNKVYYMYEMTDELSEVLTTWTNNNPNK